MEDMFCKTNDLEKEIIAENVVAMDQIGYLFETFWLNLLAA